MGKSSKKNRQNQNNQVKKSSEKAERSVVEEQNANDEGLFSKTCSLFSNATNALFGSTTDDAKGTTNDNNVTSEKKSKCHPVEVKEARAKTPEEPEGACAKKAEEAKGTQGKKQKKPEVLTDDKENINDDNDESVNEASAAPLTRRQKKCLKKRLEYEAAQNQNGVKPKGKASAKKQQNKKPEPQQESGQKETRKELVEPEDAQSEIVPVDHDKSTSQKREAKEPEEKERTAVKSNTTTDSQSHDGTREKTTKEHISGEKSIGSCEEANGVPDSWDEPTDEHWETAGEKMVTKTKQSKQQQEKQVKSDSMSYDSQSLDGTKEKAFEETKSSKKKKNKGKKNKKQEVYPLGHPDYKPPSNEQKTSQTGSWQRKPVYRKDESLLLREISGDLFDCPDDHSLAHCVSEDLHMGKGIAVTFKKRFGKVGELVAQNEQTGGLATLSHNGRFIYYLITKPDFYKKPTYASLRSSLTRMRQHCQQNGVKQLALPQIGCGLDRLDWDNVRDMLVDIFQDTAVEITIYIWD